jgi:hypothetical protein
VIYTPAAIFLNLGGGHDVTTKVRLFLEATGRADQASLLS